MVETHTCWACGQAVVLVCRQMVMEATGDQFATATQRRHLKEEVRILLRVYMHTVCMLPVTFFSCEFFHIYCRVNVEKWYKRGVPLVAWTVNKKEEKEYFDSVLQIPYLTDGCHVNTEQEVPEQSY